MHHNKYEYKNISKPANAEFVDNRSATISAPERMKLINQLSRLRKSSLSLHPKKNTCPHRPHSPSIHQSSRPVVKTPLHEIHKISSLTNSIRHLHHSPGFPLFFFSLHMLQSQTKQPPRSPYVFVPIASHGCKANHHSWVQLQPAVNSPRQSEAMY